MSSQQPLLSVRQLCVDYITESGDVRAVNSVSFDIAPGEVFGLAGESGCGKSTVAFSVARLHKPPAYISGGEILFKGENILGFDDERLRSYRWRQASVVFQSAMNALNPVLRMEEQFCDVLLAHNPGMTRYEAIKRAQELLEDNKTRAQTNTINPHSFQRYSLDAEVEALRRNPPAHVKVAKEGKFGAMEDAPDVPMGHFDISQNAPGPLGSAFKTFHTARPDVLPPGTVLYRVLDPNSYDNSICWMTKAEFDKLHNKNQWRDRFAVWRHWNHNGEYATYTVPPGEGLKVWRGATASQAMKDKAGNMVKANEQGDGFWLQGGAEQIVVNPADLQRAQLGQRQFTGWGYDEGDIQVNLVGVPILQHNWYDKK